MAQRRFTAQQSTIIRDLRRVVVDKMAASSLRINQDIISGQAEVVFDRAGRRYVFRCDGWEHPLDNLRAVGLTIDYLYRATEAYQVRGQDAAAPSDEVINRVFLGWEATPDDTVLLLGSGQEDWWDVLGVQPGATQADIREAFRALARIHHPDAGGTPEDFRRLRLAYDEAIDTVR